MLAFLDSRVVLTAHFFGLDFPRSFYLSLAILWPHLPHWFWPLAGGWEVAATLLLWHDSNVWFQHLLALPMIYFLSWWGLVIPPQEIKKRGSTIRPFTLIPASITLCFTVQFHIANVKQQGGGDNHQITITLIMQEVVQAALYFFGGFEFGALLSGGSWKKGNHRVKVK